MPAVLFFYFIGLRWHKESSGGYEADDTKKALFLCHLPISVIERPFLTSEAS